MGVRFYTSLHLGLGGGSFSGYSPRSPAVGMSIFVDLRLRFEELNIRTSPVSQGFKAVLDDISNSYCIPKASQSARSGYFPMP